MMDATSGIGLPRSADKVARRQSTSPRNQGIGETVAKLVLAEQHSYINSLIRSPVNPGDIYCTRRGEVEVYGYIASYIANDTLI